MTVAKKTWEVYWDSVLEYERIFCLEVLGRELQFLAPKIAGNPHPNLFQNKIVIYHFSRDTFRAKQTAADCSIGGTSSVCPKPRDQILANYFQNVSKTILQQVCPSKLYLFFVCF